MRTRHGYDPIILDDCRKMNPPHITIGILLPNLGSKPKVEIKGGKIYDMTRKRWFNRYNTILVPVEIDPDDNYSEFLYDDKKKQPKDIELAILKISLKKCDIENFKDLRLNQNKINIIVYHDNEFNPCNQETKNILKCIYKKVNTCRYQNSEDFSDCLSDKPAKPKKVGNSILIG